MNEVRAVKVIFQILPQKWLSSMWILLVYRLPQSTLIPWGSETVKFVASTLILREDTAPDQSVAKLFLLLNTSFLTIKWLSIIPTINSQRITCPQNRTSVLATKFTVSDPPWDTELTKTWRRLGGETQVHTNFARPLRAIISRATCLE